MAQEQENKEFPLGILEHKYGIRFDETETAIIQTMNRLFWMAYADDNSMPLEAGFRGTPLELWGLFMVVSARGFFFQSLFQRKGSMFPQAIKMEFGQLLVPNDPLTPNSIGILHKICRSSLEPDLLLHWEISINRALWSGSVETMRNTMAELIEPIASVYGSLSEIPLLNHVKFNEQEEKVMQIGYKAIVWSQLLKGDQYIIPMPTEKMVIMELWLLQQIRLLADIKTIPKIHDRELERLLKKFDIMGCAIFMPEWLLIRNSHYYTDQDTVEYATLTDYLPEMMEKTRLHIVSKLSRKEHQRYLDYKEAISQPLRMATHIAPQNMSPMRNLPKEVTHKIRNLALQDYLSRS